MWRSLPGRVVSSRAEFCDPLVSCGRDFFAGATRAHLENEKGFLGNDRDEAIELHTPGEWRHVIATGPHGVVQMATDESRGHPIEPFAMVEESEVVLHLHMTKVVPIANVRNGKFLEDLDHFGFIAETPSAVDAWARWAIQNGAHITVAPKQHRDGSYSCYLADPDGNTIQVLYEPSISPLQSIGLKNESYIP